MTEIEKLKVEVFDIIAQQGMLQQQHQQLEEVKQKKLVSLNELLSKPAEVVETK